jgi:CheY-like chemotaxis protein/anti-sigma regulatory factor (Ser/Thr protein kinase)
MYRKTKILVVDDSKLQRELTSYYLLNSNENYEVVTVVNGGEAIEHLLNEANAYDAVLLDRTMPDMDGIEVLHTLQQKQKLDNLPVILQTARTKPEEIEEGMAAGAYYYLTKPVQVDLLLSIVKAAVGDRYKTKELISTIQNQNNAIKLLNGGTFYFRTLAEADSLACLVAGMSKQKEKVVSGLYELLINAIEHGNLGITYEQKSELQAQGEWSAEIERRLGQAEYANKVAKLEAHQLSDGIEFIITDEGNGFDWQQYLTFSGDRLFDSHGRGILMANKTCFDTLEYRGAGNIVRVFSANT